MTIFAQLQSSTLIRLATCRRINTVSCMHKLKKIVDYQLFKSSRDIYCIQLPRKALKLRKKRVKSLNTLILLHEYLEPSRAHEQRPYCPLVLRRVKGTTCSLTSESSSPVSVFWIAALHSVSSSSESIGAAVHSSVV